jgi:hypothetical protein
MEKTLPLFMAFVFSVLPLELGTFVAISYILVKSCQEFNPVSLP